MNEFVNLWDSTTAETTGEPVAPHGAFKKDVHIHVLTQRFSGPGFDPEQESQTYSIK